MLGDFSCQQMQLMVFGKLGLTEEQIWIFKSILPVLGLSSEL